MDQKACQHVLIVEDSKSTAQVYCHYLEGEYQVSVVHSGKNALAAIEERSFDLILLDVHLPDISGLDILKEIGKRDSRITTIMMTAYSSVDTAVEAMRLGANDFLTKPFDRNRLIVTVNNVLKERRLSDIVQEYEKNCNRNQFHQFIGESLSMQSVYRIIESSASSNATIFITGESGTGKELCAEAIHPESDRSEKAFVALNCAAIPRDLLESEIFGHVKGAFTGAITSREGAASRASGGTLFLDEIGEMPLDLQSKLLRFIQSGTFQPVGSNREVSVDVRFICATNRDPLTEVREGRFREDLYYRLHVIPIQMPPLRERGNDCLLIAKSLLRKYNKEEKKSFSSLSPEVESLFLKYPWPGNVRELSNTIQNTVILNKGNTITIDMLPSPFNDHQEFEKLESISNKKSIIDSQFTKISEDTTSGNNETINLEEISETTPHNPQEILPLWIEEKRIIDSAIIKCNGNIPRAAAFLEVSPSTIYRKKQHWDKKKNF
ncbi:sigma-54-dependent transcriptional regulator [Zooshikella ganghwensis]|uniref:sigma-54-dependent transcriptional regulator n=1 Tax=Zooshikella ganghwensis TaxID=202772 RepID=UPI000418C546|nr:sigma-54 dependent transcriptional regulator [Zooshikella ganghwensis]